MKINRSIIKTALFVFAVCGTACTANFEDINTNPYDATKDDMNKDGYNISALLTTMQSNVLPLDVNTFQFTDCVLGGPFGGYLSDSGSWTYRISLYNATDDWMCPSFNTIITKMFSNYAKVIAATEDPVILSVADIIKVAAMQRVTDIYGPIPYSKIGLDAKLTAAYDSQEQVYTKMFEQLDNAINVLKDNRMNTFNANADNVYGGSIEKWFVFANSLKLRLAMRIAYAKPTLAQEKAEQAAPNAMQSNADNAFMKVTINPFRVVMYEYNGGESRVSSDIVSYMNGYKDPRRAAYFTVSTGSNLNDGFHGLRSGVPNDAINNSFYYSNMVVESSSPMMWLNAAEVSFLKAEGALRGWNMGVDAEVAYNRGIELSFEQHKTAGVDNYKNNNTLQPIAYTDPTGRWNGTKPSSITIKWDNSDTEKSLERIITQKWIACFPLCAESWAEYRRTGYPNLMASPTASGMGVSLGKMPARLPYPQDEFRLNKDNYLQALTMLGGTDNMATRLWWDCKNKNN